MIPAGDAAGVDRARAIIDYAHAGVEAALAELEEIRTDRRRLDLREAHLKDLIAANQAAADMLNAAMVAAGFFTAPAPQLELVVGDHSTLFERMSSIARGAAARREAEK